MRRNEDVAIVSDPRTQELFATAGEVVKGLAKAFQDFEEKRESA